MLPPPTSPHEASHHSTQTNNSASSSSTLRPRARRPVHGPSSADSFSLSQSDNHGRSSASTWSSRRPSPWPSADKSLASQSVSSLTSAWSQFQGFASSLLSSQPESSLPPTPSNRGRAHRPPAQWGPPTAPAIAQSHIGAGSAHDRAALIRDEKRKALLAANRHSPPHSSSLHKRRTSDDINSSSAPPPVDAHADVLVYIHHVKPGNTLPGLSIKYNCHQAIIRKTNRIWPNDPLQSRPIILIPVDASAVKGKRVHLPPESPSQAHLLHHDNDSAEHITMHESPIINTAVPQWSQSPTPARPPSPSPSAQTDADPLWKHEAWALLPNDTQPTEIARLSRQSLGYFPRARRKSFSFSDRSLSRNTSFDTSRPPPASPLLLPSFGCDTPDKLPSPRTSTNLPQRPKLPASRSRSASTNMSSFLQGPGGVGTLGKNVRKPGPAPDRLNDLFAQHLPSVAPPAYQTVYTPWGPSLLDDQVHDATVMADARMAGNNARGIDFQDVGGAIEGWMRKMAKRAATAMETNAATGTAKAKGNAGVQGLGLGGMGDLIELVDSFEIGDGQDEESPQGPSPLVPVASSTTASSDATPVTSTTAWQPGSGDVRGRRSARSEDRSRKTTKDD